MSINGAGADGVSGLPDEILHHILSFVPMDSAIRTGILSKRWRNLWKFNPIIEFQSLPFSHTQPIDYSFLNQCLSLYKAPKLGKLVIIARVGSYSHPNIQNWIDFAISRSVKSLEFYWEVQPMHGRVFKLPNSIYHHRNTEILEHMVLSNVDFSPPPPPPPPTPSLGFTGYASLKKLSLFESKLDNEMLESIMSTCLVLESLALHNCFGFVNLNISGLALKKFLFYGCITRGEGALEIHAPNLVTFNIRSCLKIIWLENSSSCRLVEARLFDVSIKGDVEKANVRTLLGQLAQVEILGADSWFLRFRCSCWNGIHKKLPGDVKLPRYPPGTQKEEHFPFIELEDGEEVPKIGHLHQLKSIEFFNFSGFEYEMELVRRFLQVAVSLETLTLIFEDPEQFVGEGMLQFQVPPHARELLRKQVSHYPRASPHSQILHG